MSASTKLSTSVKALGYLAQHPKTMHSSADIASAIAVNASKIRSLLSMLSKQDIVKTTQGKDGGFQLGKQPHEIHLQEIYCAIEDRSAFYLDVHDCGNGPDQFPRRVNHFFDELFSEIQIDIESKMKKITLADIVNQTQ